MSAPKLSRLMVPDGFELVLVVPYKEDVGLPSCGFEFPKVLTAS